LARAAPAITRLVDQAARTLPLAALPESCLPRDLRAVDLADDDHNSAVFSDYATTPPVTEDDIRAAMRDPANADGTEVDRLLRRLRNEQVLGEWAARIPRLLSSRHGFVGATCLVDWNSRSHSRSLFLARLPRLCLTP